MKKLVLLFSVILIVFGATAQEEQITKEEIEELILYAKAGDKELQDDIGIYYYAEQDYKQAVYWFTKAAEQGSAIAQYNLGMCYYYGHGVKKDEKKAQYWYDKSQEE